jgi:hypothetical protein
MIPHFIPHKELDEANDPFLGFGLQIHATALRELLVHMLDEFIFEFWLADF